MLKVVSDLVVSVILEWNKLDNDMRNYTSINIFKKSYLATVYQTISYQYFQLP